MIAWLWLALTACDTTPPLTETGNPDLEARMALTAHSTAPAAVSVDTGTGTVDVIDAIAAVKRVRLVMGDQCDAPGTVEWDVPVPATADLVDGTGAIPFDAKEGDYCRVRVRLDGDGDVLFVSGTRADATPFEIHSDRQVDVDVRSHADPFPLDAGTDRLLLAFDAATWLADVDLDSATVGGDGVVHVDHDDNRDQLDAFEAAVGAAMRLYRDLDGDDLVSDDDPELASGS